MLVFETAVRESTAAEDWRTAVHRIARPLLTGDADRSSAAAVAAEIATEYTGVALSSMIAELRPDGRCEPLLVRGLPVVNERDDPATDLINDLLLLGLIHAAGLRVFSYREQNDGALVQNLVPVPGHEETLTNAGRVALGWHVDESSFRRDYRPEGIALLCVDNAAGTATYLCDAADVIGALDESTLEVLRQPRFRFSVPESFHVFGGKLVYTEPRPILAVGPAGAYEIIGAEPTTIPDRHDAVAGHALAQFWQAVANVGARRDGVVLATGDLLVFSNLRGLHARDAVGGWRHIKRVAFRSDITALRTADRVGAGDNVFCCEDFVLN